MVRKAYTELSKAVYAIANDEELYPSAQVALNNFAGKQFLSKEDLAKIFSSLKTSNHADLTCSCSTNGTEIQVYDDDSYTYCKTDYGACDNGTFICDSRKGYYKQSGTGVCLKSSSSSSSSGFFTSTGTSYEFDSDLEMVTIRGCEVALELSCDRYGGTMDYNNCTCNGCFVTKDIIRNCELARGEWDSTLCYCKKRKNNGDNDDDSPSSSNGDTGGGESSTSSSNGSTGNSSGGDDIGIGTGDYNGSSLGSGDYSDGRYVLGAGTNVFGDTTVYNGASYTSNNKFAYNIGKTMKGKDLNCNNRTCTFTTSDGMYWKIEDNMNNGGYAYVNVDINGSKGTRSMTSSAPDLYPFVVDVSGHVSVGGKDIVNNASVSDSTMAVEKAKA
ncbi:hypothetical protein IJ843_05470, partial [bacterium]|nr:hypothetical protein [bacterium]